MPRSLHPNTVTVAGVAATIAAGAAVGCAGQARWLLLIAAALVALNWVTDTLDGILARQRKLCSRLGDFLDHAFDAVTVAALTIGPAFSGLVSPTLSLLQGVMILLCFALTYKGEQATGVYELLTLGPTEVRFALIITFVTAFFVRGDLFSLFGLEAQVLDIAAISGIVWASVYLVVIFARYGARLARLDRQQRCG